jgi:hypothetical protein
LRNLPGFLETTGKSVWLHHENGTILVKPSTAITVSNINKVHRPVVFACPTVFLDLVDGIVHQNDTAGAKKRDHPPVFQADKSVTIAPVAIGQRAFKVSPAFDHAGKKIGSAGIKGRIESQRNFEGRRSRHAMGLWSREIDAILKALFERNVVQRKKFERVHMVGDGERV